MPAFRVLLLLAQIACTVHVVRTGCNYVWIYIVVFVPLVGMSAYVLAEILPGLVHSRAANQAALSVVRAIDPGVCARQCALQRSRPPPRTRRGSAAEYLAAGQPEAAVPLYREVLTGVHEADPAMMLGLACALFAQGELSEAQAVLEKLRQANPNYARPRDI